MPSIFRVITLALIAGLLSSGSLALAAEKPVPGKPVADKPNVVTPRQTALNVTHEGTDSVGARLSTRLKEMYNASNLFQLNDKDAPKIRIQVLTQAEFPDRPNVGSVYAIIWTFSQSEGHLGYLLGREVGTLSPEDVDNLAAKIVERTDGIAVKFGFLFQ